MIFVAYKKASLKSIAPVLASKRPVGIAPVKPDEYEKVLLKSVATGLLNRLAGMDVRPSAFSKVLEKVVTTVLLVKRAVGRCFKGKYLYGE